MTTALKHFKSRKMPSTTHMPVGLAITPAMTTIVIDCEPVVEP
jgi:hypothetical protein